MLTIAFARRTAYAVEAISENGGQSLGIDDLHPVLRQRIRALEFVVDDALLAHSELMAANELLRARGAHIAATVLAEFVLRTVDPWVNPEMVVPPCDACRTLLSGVAFASP